MTGFWLLIPVAALGTLAFARRTPGYHRIAAGLRSPMWRVQTPSIGPRLLPLLQAASRWSTRCVDGVDLEVRRIARADGSTLTAYVYRPQNLKTGGAALLYTHGGGMIFGSAGAYHAVASAYARDLRILVVSTEYRLAPQHPFPAALDDVYATYRWLVSAAGYLQIDSRRIAVAGESAGGGLTAALCQRVHDAGDLAPRFQCLIYPMLDDRTTLSKEDARGRVVWSRGSNRFAWACYLGDPPNTRSLPAYASPARRQDLANLPPAWIGVGELDLFQREDIDYGARLLKSGVACEIVEIAGAFHGFDIVHPNADIARDFRNSVLTALRRALI